MDPIALFPDTGMLRRYAVAGLLCLCGAVLSWSIGNGSLWGAVVSGLTGLMLLGPVARVIWWPRASFAAGAQGFSVMGHGPTSWPSYSGAEVQRVHCGPVPVTAWIVVQVRSKGQVRRLHILPWRLSARADVMADRMNAYARYAQRAEDLAVAFSAPAAHDSVSDLDSALAARL
ncbi:hypothetical protein [Thalassorhabdomicrobium marinisediminis]|uniref:DUF304 domain-containing protein n=1 Tax=Thalassorhabdomicrobium marinisediminis TaxID=2170577 RepID=A0A2T7FSU6_9RHOB|nr:hypothetical protein [Thalassorhabdomicrobium marinisediminis]PVA05225.1 hypothetical protein DC363_16120 [Thalassorhabdomicrobium marinisediminis]